MHMRLHNPLTLPTFLSLPFQWANLLHLMEPTMLVGAKICKCIYMDLTHIFGRLCVGVPQFGKDEVATPEYEHDIFCNAQVMRVIRSSLSTMEYNRVRGIVSAKEICDTLKMSHEGMRKSRRKRWIFSKKRVGSICHEEG